MKRFGLLREKFDYIKLYVDHIVDSITPIHKKYKQQ